MARPYMAIAHGQMVRASSWANDDGSGYQTLCSSWMPSASSMYLASQWRNKVHGNATVVVPEPDPAPAGGILITELHIWSSLGYLLSRPSPTTYAISGVDDAIHFLRWRLQVDSGAGWDTYIDEAFPSSGLVIHANNPTLLGSLGLLPASALPNNASFYRSLFVKLGEPISLAAGHKARVQGRMVNDNTAIEYEIHMTGKWGT